jgi:hypothetical protein
VNRISIKIWKQLSQIKQFTMRAHLSMGQGEVRVSHLGRALLFHERGCWEKTGISFYNSLRWTLHEEYIRLEHLRQGSQRPVFLFDLISISEDSLHSAAPHLCGEDTYLGSMNCAGQQIQLRWSLKGPNKNEEIDVSYFS